MIRIVKTGDGRIEEFNARPAFPQEAEDAAFKVLAEIRRDGDRAVRKYVAKFEGYGRKLSSEWDGEWWKLILPASLLKKALLRRCAY